MMGSESIDVSLENIWKTWFEFKKGKRFSHEFYRFQYNLEENLFNLFQDVKNETYCHGVYRKFIVCDNKRREISVASIRDRLIHRLIYDYLNKMYDKTFIYDAWSCRLNKGLLGAIERAQDFLKSYPDGFIWKADVKKFFDSIDQATLLKILSLTIKDNKTLWLLKEVIDSFTSLPSQRVGMPIGNLTSQIFANIYLNELDRFVKHRLKPKAYLRYGDDFILVETDSEKLKSFRLEGINFLNNELKLIMNSQSDKILKSEQGLKFLGVKLWSSGRTLNRRNLLRAKERLNQKNVSSYSGLIKEHTSHKRVKTFNWIVYEKLLADL